MVTENFNKLIGLITGSYINRIGVISKLIYDLDNIPDKEKVIAQLYLSISLEEQNMVKQVVNALSKTQPILSSESPQTALKLQSEALVVSYVHRNEQVNVVSLSKGLQTVLCSNLTHGTYYLLWPMVGDSDQFNLSPEGENYQWQIRREFDKRLDRFPRNFVAGVYASAKLTHNTVEFWEEMKSSGLFKYWDPQKGPYTWCNRTADPRVQMLRVYRVDLDLKSYVIPNKGFRYAPSWKGGLVRCQGIPVLDDNQMKQQLDKFNQILQKHDNHPIMKI